MKKIIFCLIIAIIAFVGFLTKSKQVQNEILVMPVDLSKTETFSGILDCRIPCAVLFEIILENTEENTEELAKQLEECDIRVELLMDGAFTEKKVSIFHVKPNQLKLYVDNRLMEGLTLGQHDVNLVVDRGVECLAGVKQTLTVTQGCYGPESFKGFLYGSVCIICMIFAIIFYNNLCRNKQNNIGEE